MAHYDGPVFHRPESPKPAAYPLPPRGLRHHEAKPATPQSDLTVAPMDALVTPDSVAKRKREDQVDYLKIVQALTVAPDRLYVLDDGSADAPWAQPAPEAEDADDLSSANDDSAGSREALASTTTTDTQPQRDETRAARVTESAAPADDHPEDEPETPLAADIDPQTVDRELAQTTPLTQVKTADGHVPATVSELLRTPAASQTAPPSRPHRASTRPDPRAVAGSVRSFLAGQKPRSDERRSEEPPVAASAQTQGQLAAYQLPPLSLLKPPVQADAAAQRAWVDKQTAQLDAALANFHVDAHVVTSTVGPTVTQYQLRLAPGVKVSKITNLQDDLKLALAARDIRIEAPIPGHSTVGIEVPNQKARPVMLKEILAAPAFRDAKSPLTIALGVNLFGQPVVANLANMPHGLIAGATGAGKSVFINSLITSLLYKATPQQVRLLLIDPKAVELAVYDGLPHLVAPVVSDPKSASAALKWVVDEMERRYEKMAAAHARSLAQFNALARQHGKDSQVMPSIVVIIDELADLMLVAASEIQDYIARITAKARAAGIHLIVATQRPSVDVITGTIKNNIPTRIAFMVASQVDSRTIIDHAGAENLLGRGDMLYLGNGASQPIRLQGAFIDSELEQVTAFVRQQQPPQYLFDPHQLVKKAQAIEAQDDLFPQVLKYVAAADTVSTSALQRQFSIGYNRAAKLIDELTDRHYISAQNGAKPRDVYINKQDLPTPHDAG
ncbi:MULTISPECIES: DNA translocase FtsK [unclassified Lacticaseibacillus]|uniref:DNA translocase FtsK n=1 Tax=unclassified Lacticaseibacillus TaxID=2759744 RepID=UPI001940BF7C|nr:MULTISPECIES: DNA translocase FtsK [unclassified Lacticaseibacillus]